MRYLNKFKGQNAALPPRPAYKEILLAWIGGFLAIALIGYLTKASGLLLVMGSFGASSVLLFGYPGSPFSQPRNVLAGHLISSSVGVAFLFLFGNEWWGMAMALATATALMMATRTVHPPAGSNPLIVFLLEAQWDYIVFPTLMGSVILIAVALLFNNLHAGRSYPAYW